VGPFVGPAVEGELDGLPRVTVGPKVMGLEVGPEVGSLLGPRVGASVGPPVGLLDGSEVDAKVGLLVGTEAGPKVGTDVGMPEGLTVGDSNIGRSVGGKVGVPVGGRVIGELFSPPATAAASLVGVFAVCELVGSNVRAIDKVPEGLFVD